MNSISVTVELPSIHPSLPSVARHAVGLALIALASCRGATGDEARSRAALEASLAACEQRVAQLEEDDRYLFAEGAADLERGWNTTACERFETLLRRFPQSPLAAEARSRMQRCASGAPTTPAGLATAATEPPPAAVAADDARSGAAGAASAATTSAPDAAPPAEDASAPLEVTRSWVKEDRFGVPLANLRLTNRGDRTVVGYKVALRCYDEHDTVLKHLTKGTRWFVAAGGSRQAGRGEAFAGGPWPLTAFLGTTRVEAVVLSADFADGTTWQRDDLSSFGIDKE